MALTLVLVACASGRPAQREAGGAETWREKPPEPGPPPALVTPTFAKRVQGNGLTLIVSERHELPLVSFGVAIAAGSAADPPGKAGLAELTYGLLLEGTEARDALALDTAFADIGASPFVKVGPDGATIGVRALRRNAEKALALLAEAVLRPRFDASGFDRRQKQQLSDLAVKAGSPHFLASEAFSAIAFGAAHPYGHPFSGTKETVEGLTLSDAKQFYAEKTGPKAAALVVGGDVTVEEAEAWVTAAFSRWKGSATRVGPPPEPKALARERVVFVPKPGLGQTVILMGRPAISVGHPDEFALDIAGAIFGGFFGSRLNMNLREAKGYSYGARAYVDPRFGVGPLVAMSSVRADVTGPAIGEFLKELSALKARPFTAEELEAARNGIVRSIPGSFETVEGLAAAAAGLFFENQPLDRYRKMIDGYRRAELSEVQRAAEEYFEPSLLQVILVGDPKIIEAQVAPLSLGALEERAVR